MRSDRLDLNPRQPKRSLEMALAERRKEWEELVSKCNPSYVLDFPRCDAEAGVLSGDGFLVSPHAERGDPPPTDIFVCIPFTITWSARDGFFLAPKAMNVPNHGRPPKSDKLATVLSLAAHEYLPPAAPENRFSERKSWQDYFNAKDDWGLK
jgi:hypothetical protein